MNNRFVSYIRVSTDKQGVSGLGLAAQQSEVDRFIGGRNATLVAEYQEVESGKNGTERPQLDAALNACRLHRASLVIAKLDRLSRSAVFLHNLQAGGVQFICIDMPEANQLVLSIMIAVAEDERDRISSRTRAALAAKKAQGHKLGGRRPGDRAPNDEERAKSASSRLAKARQTAERYAPTIHELQEEGIVSQRAIAVALEERRIPTPSGSLTWHAAQVGRILKYIAPSVA